jgi:hypothetical protein
LLGRLARHDDKPDSEAFVLELLSATFDTPPTAALKVLVGIV